MQTVNTHEQQLEKVGKIVPSSKLKYTWAFDIDGDQYTVNLYHSKITHKFEVRINGKIYMVDRGKSAEDFKYTTRLTNHEIKIMKPNSSESFHLFIDHRDFTTIKPPEKTEVINSNFKGNNTDDGILSKGSNTHNRFTQQYKVSPFLQSVSKEKGIRHMSVNCNTPNNEFKNFQKCPKTTDYTNFKFEQNMKDKKNVEGTLNGLKFSGIETSDIFFNDGVTLLDIQQDCNSNVIKEVNEGSK